MGFSDRDERIERDCDYWLFRVYRYSWWCGRRRQMPFINWISGSNGKSAPRLVKKLFFEKCLNEANGIHRLGIQITDFNIKSNILCWKLILFFCWIVFIGAEEFSMISGDIRPVLTPVWNCGFLFMTHFDVAVTLSRGSTTSCTITIGQSWWLIQIYFQNWVQSTNGLLFWDCAFANHNQKLPFLQCKLNKKNLFVIFISNL